MTPLMLLAGPAARPSPPGRARATRIAAGAGAVAALIAWATPSADARLRAAGALRLAQGDVAGALTTFRDLVARHPDEGLAARRLGDGLFEAQRYDESARAYLVAAEAPHPDLEALRRAALLELRRGRPEDARRLLERFLEQRPGDADAQLAAALLAVSRADIDEAHAHVARADALGPAADYVRGRLALHRNDLQAARTAFAAAAARAPHDPYGAYGLAVLAAREGQAAAACDAFAHARAAGLNDESAIRRDEAAGPLRALACGRKTGAP